MSEMTKSGQNWLLDRAKFLARHEQWIMRSFHKY